MLQEFKNFLKVQNLLLENSNLTLNESTEIANFIIDIIEKYNKEMEGKKYKDKTPFIKLKINTDLPNIQRVDVGESDKMLIIKTNDGKTQEIKIGRLLRQLLPNARDEDIEDINYLVKRKIFDRNNSFKKYSFEITNYKISSWYSEFHNSSLGSCMTFDDIIENGVLNFFDLDNNIKLLLIKNKIPIYLDNNEEISAYTVIARALVWYNTSLGKPFIDRLYVRDNLNYMDIYNIMVLWAEKNDYAYRGPGLQDNSINNTPSHRIEYQIPEKVWEKIDYLPYMDTLCYLDNKTKTLSNIEDSDNENIIELHSDMGTRVSISLWEQYFNDETEIENWIKMFDYPKEAKEWKDIFGNDYKLVDKLSEIFSDPKIAKEWYDKIDLEDIEKFSKYFANPDEVWKWYNNISKNIEDSICDWKYQFDNAKLKEASLLSKYFKTAWEARKHYDRYNGDLKKIINSL